MARPYLLVQIVHRTDARHPGAIKLKQRLLHIPQTITARPPQRRLQSRHQPKVLLDKSMIHSVYRLHQGTANKHFRSGHRIDATVIDLSAANLQSMHEHAFGDEDAPAFFLPAGVAKPVFTQLRGDAFDPSRINAGHGAGKQLRGLDDFTGHDPRGLRGFGRGRSGLSPDRAFVHMGSGKKSHQSIPGSLVRVAAVAHANMPEQAGENAPMNGVLIHFPRQRSHPRLVIARHGVAQLAVQITPLGHAQE